jgi:hypothetical protein
MGTYVVGHEKRRALIAAFSGELANWNATDGA